MRSYRLEKPGQVAGIVPHESAEPSPKPTEIVVRVRAASLNRRDVLILHERYPAYYMDGDPFGKVIIRVA